MIEKMKFLSITGPKTDIDRVVNDYLSKYEIHLENAMAQLTQKMPWPSLLRSSIYLPISRSIPTEICWQR